jgi:hypothetical protein
MPCISLSQIVNDCSTTNLGGIKSITVYDWDSTLTGGTQYTGTSVSVEFNKESASYTQEETIDVATGAISVVQTLQGNVAKRDATKSNAIKAMGAGARNLVIKITDRNGFVSYMGIATGANLTKVSAQSGTKGSDGNMYQLTFVATEPQID